MISQVFAIIGGTLGLLLANAYVIQPYIDEMMPLISTLGTPVEIAFWGLLPLIIYVMTPAVALVALALIIKRARNPA